MSQAFVQHLSKLSWTCYQQKYVLTNQELFVGYPWTLTTKKQMISAHSKMVIFYIKKQSSVFILIYTSYCKSRFSFNFYYWFIIKGYKYLVFSNVVFVSKTNRKGSIQNSLDHVLIARLFEGKQWLVPRNHHKPLPLLR